MSEAKPVTPVNDANRVDGLRHRVRAMGRHLDALGRRLARPLVLAVLALVVAALASAVWVVESEREHREATRLAATRVADRTALRLHEALDDQARLLDDVALLVQQTQGELGAFEARLSGLLINYPQVVELALLPDGVVARHLPADAVVRDQGHNLLEGPHRLPAAVQAAAEGRRVFFGPQDRADGRRLIWAYQPVFLGASQAARGGAAPPPLPGDLWGLLRVAIDLDGLVRAAGLADLQAQGYDHELLAAGAEGEAVLDRQPPLDASLADPVSVDVPLDDLRWRLRLAPTGGWDASPTLVWKLLWAAFFCAATAGVVYLLAQRMRLTNSLLHNLSAHVPGVLYQYHEWPDGRRACFDYLSPGIETLTGLDAQALMASDRAWREHLLSPDREELVAAMALALRQQTTLDAEFRVRHTDGSVRWLYTRAMPQRQDDGSVVWHGYLSDWTAEKQTAEALAQSNRLLAEAQEVARLGYFWTDVQSGRWTSSPLLDEVLGIGPDFERDAAGWLRLVDPAHRARLREAYQQAVQTRSTFNIEYPLQRPSDGRAIWVHLMGRLEFDEQGRPQRLVGTIQDITARKKAEEAVRQLAYFDPLTGLPNRRLLLERLGQVLLARAADGLHGALMFIDLDNFKDLNDALGHDQGDALLRLVALRLQGCVRGHDTVARLGGDEFVLLVDCLESEPAEGWSDSRSPGLAEGVVRAPDPLRMAEDLALAVVAALSRPYPLGERLHTSTPSVGVAVFSNEGLSVDDVLKRADVAMYQAKAAGRNTVRFYDPAIQAELAERLRLAEDLRRALVESQFFLQYQPQHDADGALVGAEALLRWRHPQRGLVSPAVFVPLAEQTGQMETLGQWVLHTACQQLQRWLSEHHLRERHPQFTLAVNVSAHQFRSPNVVADVRRALSQTQLPPGVLKLELTESLMVHDVEDIIAKMTEIRQLGVLFSLDDFGTGYSSLTYLKRLPLDQLKIDQSFVRELLDSAHDAAIARTVVALGQTLGLDVIAEGVETAAQRAQLLSMGCTRYQGYWFSKPLNAEDFLAYALA